MIVGTAGHIDHGKTSLVKALTGVDADRLREEKARGISIDLGFAYKPLADGQTLGFIDVPGHEKLIHNMLAGATGIDYVVLVIAADDGPMPQTREHLAILDLLGLDHGVIALSKCDLADAARIDAVRSEIHALLAGTALAEAEVIALSSATGAGIDTLDHHLAQAAAALPAARDGGRFRLAVDRSFTLPGIGTVVTGTAFAGRVAAGDRLLVTPSGREVRVRSVHAQNRAADAGHAGQRCALNIAGGNLHKSDIERGDWIVAPECHAPTERIDARLRVLDSEPKPVRHWLPVHLHLGAADVGARIAVLDGESIAPGASARVQLVLDRPIGALRGDRFIVRDQSAQRTIGGGAVIDAFAPERGRRKPQRLAVLDALEAPSAAQSLRRLLEESLGAGVDLRWFCRLWNLGADDEAALLRDVDVVLPNGDSSLAVAPAVWQGWQARLLAALAAHHQREADSPGATLPQLQRSLPGKLSATLVVSLAAGLQATHALRRNGPYLRLPQHEVRLSDAEQALWERMQPRLQEAANQPPKLAELARDLQLGEERLRELAPRLVRIGRVHAVGRDYLLLPHTVRQLAADAERLAREHPRGLLTVGALRAASGVGRHLSLPLLEFFDRVGLTARIKDGRRLRRGWQEVFGA